MVLNKLKISLLIKRDSSKFNEILEKTEHDTTIERKLQEGHKVEIGRYLFNFLGTLFTCRIEKYQVSFC